MNVYQIVTERIIKQLEAGTVPWRKPWRTLGGEAPTNLVSKKEYRGINVWLLGSLGYKRPFFVSYKQAQQLGGHVKSGEHGHLAIFWKKSTYNKTVTNEHGEETEETRNGLLLRYYTVFNVEQCDGLEKHLPVEPTVPKEPERIAAAELIAKEFYRGPNVRQASYAAYRPSTDEVLLPARHAFTSPAEYYSTLFHEYGHSTGHATRLNRKGIAECSSYFGSPTYSQEELVAELTSAYLCAKAGIENVQTFQNTAAYLQHWIDNLKGDSKLLVHAAAQAQKAADFVLNIRYDEKVEEKEAALAA